MPPFAQQMKEKKKMKKYPFNHVQNKKSPSFIPSPPYMKHTVLPAQSAKFSPNDRREGLTTDDEKRKSPSPHAEKERICSPCAIREERMAKCVARGSCLARGWTAVIPPHQKRVITAHYIQFTHFSSYAIHIE